MTDTDSGSPGDSSGAARRLLEIVGAGWVSQAAFVAASLRIPDLLAARAQSSGELARATGAHPASLHRLMRALVTIDVCSQRDDGSYELTAMGSLLRADAADSLRSWTLYWGGSLWGVWGNLLHSVMTGESARKLTNAGDRFDQLEVDPDAAAVFNQAMVELTRLDAASVARAFDFSRIRRIVDVGGGYGELLAAILQANPGAHGVLFDRPHAIEHGRRRMETAGIAARCEFVVGDFFESIPAGGDAYVLKSVIHDWNDERSRVVLGNCRGAMHERARLFLVERIFPSQLGTSAADRAMARSDLNMLVGVGGQERTEEEYRNLLGATKLQMLAVHQAGPTFSIMEAVRSP